MIKDETALKTISLMEKINKLDENVKPMCNAKPMFMTKAKPMKIYVASSWKNVYQPEVVNRLLAFGFDVYDFRNPMDINDFGKDNGFHWSEVDSNWKQWTYQEYSNALDRDFARSGFNKDFTAMQECNACVLVLPCGRSAHIEAGWCKGNGKQLCIYIPQEMTFKGENDAELMYKLADYLSNDLSAIINYLKYGLK